jgi:rhamnosyltransferase
MDQDSAAAEGMVDGLVEAIEQNGEIGIAAPRSVESVNGRVYGLGATEGRAGAVQFVKLVHTSGSLIPVRVFESIGLFREDLFIDQVDYEFCLRLRKSGLRIAIADRAKMWHRLGSISTTQVLWKTLHCANYSRERHYYLARNRIAVGRLHKDLSYIRSQADSMAREICKIVLCERGKMKKLRAVATGVLDGMRGRLGKWNG